MIKSKSDEGCYQMIDEIEDYAILRLDLQGNIVTWNKGAEKIKGYTSKEIIGKNFNIFYSKEDRDNKLPEKLIEKATLLGQAKDEGWRMRKDGSRFWGNILISSIHDENNNVIGFSKITRDLTDKKSVDEIKKTLDQAKENLLKIFNASPAGMSLTDAKSRKFVEVNKQFLKTFGFNRDEVIGFSALELEILSNDSNIKLADMLKKQGCLKNEAFLCYTQNKKEVNCIVSTDLIEMEGIEYFLSVFIDLTEVKEMEKNIAESEEKFQKTFQISPAGITITNLSSSIFLDANDAFLEMTGFSKEEVVGHTSKELGIIKVGDEKREKLLENIKKNGSEKHFELTLHSKSGKKVVVLSSGDTILLKGKKHLVSTVFDITERKIAEEQLLSVNKELEAFSYTVSHDLKAPLRSVNNYAQMLEMEYNKFLDEDGKKFLTAIKNNATKMSNLIEDLLSFSKLGMKAVDKNELDMNKLVKEVLTDINNTINHNAEITLGTLPSAQADPALIKQVVVNLLSNAIKYTSKTKTPIIEITSEFSDGEVIYIVKDNGDGFDMRHIDKLFGVFQRLHTSNQFEGTGVGLATVKRIINKHGGRIWAEAEPGKGATFRFTLPS